MVLEVGLGQIGALYEPPVEIYQQAHLPELIANELDVIALCRRRVTQPPGDIHYALAVRLRASGAVDVLLPHLQGWVPSAQAGFTIGQVFADARCDRSINGKRANSKIKLSGTQLAQFAARVLTQKYNNSTLALIEAEGWRNERGEDEESKIWPQLKNEYLWQQRDVLDFRHVPGFNKKYQRNHEDLRNLLSLIRLRIGKETPQYITNRSSWFEDGESRDFRFCDRSVPDLLHYFSVGRLPQTQKRQDSATARELYMLDSHLRGNPRFDEYGANMLYKHPQMVEMVPFFVRSDLQTEQGLTALCRVLHYLRASPAWTMGNIVLPYPMHLGGQLIEDQLCILGVVDMILTRNPGPKDRLESHNLRGGPDAEKRLYRRTDYVRAAPGGSRNAGARGLPQAWRHRADLLPLETQIRGPGRGRAAETPPAGGRES